MNKTKEEILNTHLNDNHGAGQTFRDIQKAMDEYAKQEAIEFMNWKKNYDMMGKIKSAKERVDGTFTFISKLPLASEQLYELYIQSKTK